MLRDLNRFAAFVAFSIIATIPLLFGAVEPWVWAFYCLTIIVEAILVLWATVSQKSFSQPGILNIAVIVFFSWTFFLCIPLPHPILSFLSRQRADVISKTWVLAGSIPTHAAISYSPQKALAWWTFLLSLGLFYLVIRNLCRDGKTLKAMVLMMIMIGILESVYGMVQALIPSMGVLWVDYLPDYMGTARGTFINRNNFAGFIEMIWPLALGLTLSMTGRLHSIRMILHSDRLNRQALMGLCIIVFLLTLMLTRSRAGIVSGMVGFFVFFTLARPGMQHRARQIRIMMGGIATLLAIYVLTIGMGPVVERFLDIGGDGSSRIGIWHDSLLILRDHPLGIGLHNYADVVEIYNRTGIHGKTIGYAHNDYLQLLIEAGWIGFATLLGALLVFLIRCTQRIRRLDFRKDPLRFYLAVGAFSGIVSIGVHSLFDFNLQIPANCVYFVVLMAILSACTRSGPSVVSRRPLTKSEPMVKPSF